VTRNTRKFRGRKSTETPGEPKKPPGKLVNSIVLRPYFSSLGLIALGAFGSSLLVASARAAEGTAEHPGAKVYTQMCAACHGKKGEGVAEKYDDPLMGNRSVSSLTKYISRTMPEGKEGTCVGADAENVAAYIFDSFYSPAAQARNNPVRESLTRLTVAQYQNSIAELIGRFRGGYDRDPGKERGFKAQYSGKKPQVFGPFLAPEENNVEKDEGKRRGKERARYEQIDQRISFKFGAASPDPARLRADEFSLRWEGAIIAPETGVYEFIAKTENGIRLFLNNPKDPFIDAWVTPGPDVREEKKSIFLLGGRAYPFALEHFKYREKSASVELLWKPPHGRVSPVPASHVTPQGWPAAMVVTTTFPADDRSDGYERGTTISKEWDQATTRGALEVMAYVEQNLDSLAGTKSGASDRVDKLKDFSKRFVEAAFRRPLTDDQRQNYIERQFQTAATPEIGMKRVVLLALKSPRFLYPELAHEEHFDDWRIASRLAEELWDSIPDGRLARTASEGRLKTRDQILREAQRMIADPRAKAKLHGFFHHWLELDRAESAQKDPKAFPGFDESMMADLRESLWRFVDGVVWSESSDYRQLIAADYLWLNERLGKYYGKPVSGEEFQRVGFDANQRAGVVTHPYLLASLSYARSTSPIHRGVFLSRNIVGLALKNPSVAVAFEDSKFDPKLTMREKVSELTKSASCMGCHSTINPLGFTLENFDAVGRWRTQDNNKPVHATDEFHDDDGRMIVVKGPKDVANYALGSPSAHRAFVRQLFHHTVKQPTAAYGEATLDTLRQQFEANGFNIQKLLAEIAVTSAMHGLPSPNPPPKVAQNPPPATP